MRQDQFIRIQQLLVQLTDAFLEEAAPDQWPGHGLTLAALDQQTRGDRYWCKKNAVATASLMARVQSMVAADRWRALAEPVEPLLDGEPPANDHDVDHEIARYEKEAARMVEAVIKRAGVK